MTSRKTPENLSRPPGRCRAGNRHRSGVPEPVRCQAPSLVARDQVTGLAQECDGDRGRIGACALSFDELRVCE